MNRAIEQLNSPVEIQKIWSPFELNPDMPEAGMDRIAARSLAVGNIRGNWMRTHFKPLKTMASDFATT
ncbi:MULTISPECIES: hypothetical protein [Trichocoleus]|uniref:Uncharacterized protein n=1 Tax=Trichocoleus desertorum GB2-A4 TaxID=2933944 RepID=A0ABV0JEL7_9CYAN|nr:hypothetical protein [Trichocoleus sp. FACHB-46]